MDEDTNKKVCIRQCKLNITENICRGCGRTLEEIKEAYEIYKMAKNNENIED